MAVNLGSNYQGDETLTLAARKLSSANVLAPIMCYHE